MATLERLAAEVEKARLAATEGTIREAANIFRLGQAERKEVKKARSQGT